MDNKIVDRGYLNRVKKILKKKLLNKILLEKWEKIFK